ncbi:hyaluronan and proteoglycan link protein 1 isoform X1 [Syngnathus scovelli]|uniref:hyaluronan and proteoglycan link protein 1 isoform X1 n=1 Tax=Syngnathus scovelli TaxID=161590 RepID=UPI00210F6B50|nr:hyaluronan and proteoglycan link protein 1 isoform X1 [Syngnathus scovelli]
MEASLTVLFCSEPNLRVAKMSGAIRALTLASLWLSAADGFRSFSPEPDFSPNVHETDNAQPALSVTSQPSRVLSRRGGNATLPCTVRRDGWPAPNGKMRIKWTKLTSGLLTEVDVLAAAEQHKRSYGGFHGRVRLRSSSPWDASLVIDDITLDDYGSYKCEVIDGLEDAAAVVSLDLEGVVFPYSPRLGRYNLKFRDAERACREQDGVVASPEQLREAWRRGLDWCNAGWLSDGSVRYPVTSPREPCGGQSTPAGVRNYGPRDKDSSRFDVFCFTSHYKGDFYFLPRVGKLTYGEAAAACRRDGARLATVGHMYAAWKLAGYDRCDAGWLADGSVRYPVARPRPRCSPARPAVGFLGFPDKKHKLYGVYCFGPGRRAARRHRGAR